MLSSYSAKITHRHLVLRPSELLHAFVTNTVLCCEQQSNSIIGHWYQNYGGKQWRHMLMVSGAKQGHQTGNGSSRDKDEVLISKYFQYTSGCNLFEFPFIFGSLGWKIMNPPSSPGSGGGFAALHCLSRRALGISEDFSNGRCVRGFLGGGS